MIIRAAPGKKDERAHHCGKTMIGRTSSQQGKLNKRRDKRKIHK
jgi:hypothetical protein